MNEYGAYIFGLAIPATENLSRSDVAFGAVINMPPHVCNQLGSRCKREAKLNYPIG